MNDSGSAGAAFRQGAVKTIAVIDCVPAYRHGLVAVLTDDGYHALPLRDAGELADGIADMVMFGIRGGSDWEILPDLTQRHRVIAVLTDASAGPYSDALMNGAIGVVGREAEFAQLRDVVAAAAAGNVLLPYAMLTGLLRDLVSRAGTSVLTGEERRLLEALSRGDTVVELAGEEGRSRATMYRLLASIRSHLGVSTNAEAIARVEHDKTLRERRHSGRDDTPA